MVVEQTALDKRFKMRRNFYDVQARHKAQLHKRVRADVSAAERAARTLRVGAPVGAAFSALLFDLFCEPALYIGRINPAYLAEKSACDNEARKPRRPVSEIGVGNRERQTFCPLRPQLFRRPVRD